MKTIDLHYHPYFEVKPDSRVEVFIDGKKRMFANPRGQSRLYVLIFADSEPDGEDDDILPF